MGTTGAACFKKKQDVNTTHYFLCETCGHGVFLQTSTDTALEATAHAIFIVVIIGVEVLTRPRLQPRVSIIRGRQGAQLSRPCVASELQRGAASLPKCQMEKKNLPACCMIFFQMEIGLQLAGVDSTGVWEQTSNALVGSTWVVARRERERCRQSSSDILSTIAAASHLVKLMLQPLQSKLQHTIMYKNAHDSRGAQNTNCQSISRYA